MLDNFQLAVIVKKGIQRQILQVPLAGQLQDLLATDWQSQLDAFQQDMQFIKFDAGYQPEAHECFVLESFEPPDWLARVSSTNVCNFDEMPRVDSVLDKVVGVAALARDAAGAERVLFQNFSRSHVIQPGRGLFLDGNTYGASNKRGLTLGNHLSAVYLRPEGKLLFRSFRTVNAFMPLGDHYQEASEQQIREVLAHPNLDAESIDALALNANQWFKRRFAMLRDSKVLDDHSPQDIKARSTGYEVDVTVRNGRIVFPADKQAAKKLLQFLNEELYRGAITEKLFEANSKRAAD